MKRKCRGSSPYDPKICPNVRVQEFPNDKLCVSAGKLFCSACREELSLKRSVIVNHINSTKHKTSMRKLDMNEAREKDIAESLEVHNDENHLNGETLPIKQQVYRVKVVTAFLRAGIPLSKLDSFRDILEENAYRLTNRRHMFDLVPFILKEEEKRISSEIQGKPVAVIFDGTTRLGEAMAIVLRFVDDNFSPKQYLIRMQMLSKSMVAEELARELISVLSVKYSVPSELFLGAMHDRASVNLSAMQTIKIVYPLIVDIGCFSHTIDRVGEKFKTEVLTEFIHSWIMLFSHSSKVKMLWKSQVGCSMISYSTTRWWSKWEVIKMLMLKFGDIELFLSRNEDIGPTLRPKLLGILQNPQKKAFLQIEIAAVVDWGEPFVKACYFLEGDGPLAVDAYEAMERVASAIRTANIPNVHAVIEQSINIPRSDPRHQQLISYAQSCVQPGLNYFEAQVSTNLKTSLEAFKCARLLSLQKIHLLQPDATAVQESLAAVPFLNNQSTVSGLLTELPDYLVKAASTDPEFPVTEFWKLNVTTLPNWSKAASKVLLLQPSSAAAERVFSLLKSSFGDLQDNSLQDYIESSLMLQFNN